MASCDMRITVMTVGEQHLSDAVAWRGHGRELPARFFSALPCEYCNRMPRAGTNTVAIYRLVVYSRQLSCAKPGNPAVHYRSRRK